MISGVKTLIYDTTGSPKIPTVLQQDMLKPNDKRTWKTGAKTVAGLSSDGKIMYFMKCYDVVPYEAAALLLQLGSTKAIMFDSGHSTQYAHRLNEDLVAEESWPGTQVANFVVLNKI